MVNWSCHWTCHLDERFQLQRRVTVASDWLCGTGFGRNLRGDLLRVYGASHRPRRLCAGQQDAGRSECLVGSPGSPYFLDHGESHYRVFRGLCFGMLPGRRKPKVRGVVCLCRGILQRPA